VLHVPLLHTVSDLSVFRELHHGLSGKAVAHEDEKNLRLKERRRLLRW